MWTVVGPGGAARAAAVAAYVAAVAGFLWVQEVGLRLLREERQAWWAGSGRDLLNLAGLVAIAGALRLLGFTGPAALLVGGTLTLLLFGASVFMATQTDTAHPRAWAVLAGAALALPVLLFPAQVAGAFGAAAEALFVLPPSPGR
jgi:hypothetical protein